MTAKTRPTLIVNEIRAIARYARERIHTGPHVRVGLELAEQLELLADKLAQESEQRNALRCAYVEERSNGTQARCVRQVRWCEAGELWCERHCPSRMDERAEASRRRWDKYASTEDPT